MIGTMLAAAAVAVGSLIPTALQCGDLPAEPVTHVPFAWATYAIEAGGGDWEYRTANGHRVPWGWQNETKSDWQVNNCFDAVEAKYNIWAGDGVPLQVLAICRGQGARVSFVLPHHG